MIGSSENRISYNGNGIATEFAYNFIILEKSDIKVLHVAADGTEQLLTKDYYVDMEKSVVLYPGYAPGAEIPEQNRPPVLPVGERLVIYREVPITQDSALDKHWPFNVVENGLDKLTIICQQIWDRLQRSFYVSESTSTNFDPKVPIEAGKTFRVKDDGTGFEVTEDPGKVIDEAKELLELNTEQANIAVESSTNAQNAANSVKKYKALWFDSVAAMKAEPSLTAGAYVCTAGYYAPNDGGGASYLIRAKADADVDDGGSLHELANGLVAELIVEDGTVNVKQFGAKGDANYSRVESIDGTDVNVWYADSGCTIPANDDSSAFVTMFALYNRIYIPAGVYLVTRDINVKKETFVSGNGNTYIILTNNSSFKLSTYCRFSFVNFKFCDKIFGGDIRYATLNSCGFYSSGVVFSCNDKEDTGKTWNGCISSNDCFYDNCFLFDSVYQLNIVTFKGGYINHCSIISPNITVDQNLEAWTFNNVDMEFSDFYIGNHNIRARQITFNECYLEHCTILDITGSLLSRTVITLKNCWLFVDQKLFNIITTTPIGDTNGTIIFDNCCTQILDESVLPVVKLSWARYVVKYIGSYSSTTISNQIITDINVLFEVKSTPIIELAYYYTNNISHINTENLSIGASATKEENILKFNNLTKFYSMVNKIETPMLQCYPIKGYDELRNLPSDIPAVCLLYFQSGNEMFLKTSFSGTQIYKLNMTSWE